MNIAKLNRDTVVISSKQNPMDCAFLDSNGRCGIYANRPQICRDFGVIETMPCPYKGMKL